MRQKMAFEELYTPHQRFVKCSVKKMLNQSLFLWYKKGIENTIPSIERLKKSPLIFELMTTFKE
jgi:hypothetical protein